jgi:hypothetical protein
MKTKLIAGAGALVLVATVAVAGLMFSGGEAQAQGVEQYEYGYMLPVPRLESYEIDVKRWAGNDKDKEYLRSRVFVYEEGQTSFERQINSLRLLDKLSADGWELHDAKAGVLRRKK